jgi:hypothetical protein
LQQSTVVETERVGPPIVPSQCDSPGGRIEVPLLSPPPANGVRTAHLLSNKDAQDLSAVTKIGYKKVGAISSWQAPGSVQKRAALVRRPEFREETPKEAYAASLLHCDNDAEPEFVQQERQIVRSAFPVLHVCGPCREAGTSGHDDRSRYVFHDHHREFRERPAHKGEWASLCASA